MNFLTIGLGGFLGAILRYLVYLNLRPASSASFPFATLFVNLTGCFLIGWLMGFIQKDQAAFLHPTLLLTATVGFLGSFTTFSAFGFETFQLIRLHLHSLAALNVAANIFLGLLLVLAGHWAAGSIR